VIGGHNLQRLKDKDPSLTRVKGVVKAKYTTGKNNTTTVSKENGKRDSLTPRRISDDEKKGEAKIASAKNEKKRPEFGTIHSRKRKKAHTPPV
jgi:hypothetical protein